MPERKPLRIVHTSDVHLGAYAGSGDAKWNARRELMELTFERVIDLAERTVRHGPDGSATVAVVVKGRPHQAVVADLIEGIVIANDLSGAEATRVRTRLWEAVVHARVDAA